eukprot:g306.t1
MSSSSTKKKVKKKSKKDVKAEEDAAAAELERERLEQEEKRRLRAEALDVVNAFLKEDVVQRCASVLYEKYLKEKTVKYTTQICVEKLLHVLSGQSLTHPTKTECDGTPENAGDKEDAWIVDEEPVPPPIDTWARGAIRVHKRSSSKTSTKIEYEDDSDGLRSSTKKSRGGISFASAALALKKKKKRRDLAADASSSTSLGTMPSTHIFVRTKTPKLPSRKDVEAMRLKREAEKKEEERRDRMKREKEETDQERSLRHTFERINALKKRQAEEVMRYESIAKDMKGKTYTFDRSGKLVVIHPLPQKKMLAPVTADVAIQGGNVRDDGANVEESDGGKDTGGGKTKKRSATTRRSPRRGRRRHDDTTKSATATTTGRSRVITSVVSTVDLGAATSGGDDDHVDNRRSSSRFFVEETHKQPPLTSSMRLSPGVNVRDGKHRRRGPRQSPTNPLRMTRSMFVEHQNRLVEMDSTFSFATTTGAYPASWADGRAMSPASSQCREGELRSRLPDPSTVASTGRPGTYRSATSISSASPRNIRDVNAFAGARDVGRPRTEDDRGSVVGAEDDVDEEDDENILLSSAPDWGANPTRHESYSPPTSVRHAPREHTLQALGSLSKHPRERAHQSRPLRRRRPVPHNSKLRDAAIETGVVLSNNEGSPTSHEWATRREDVREGEEGSVNVTTRNLGATAPASSSSMRAETRRYFAKPSPGTITRTVSSDLARLL